MADIQIEDRVITVDAEIVGKALSIDKSLVQPLMREGKITTLSEHGIDDDAGTCRLTFFYQSRRARLIVGERGQVIRLSSIDFGGLQVRR